MSKQDIPAPLFCVLPVLDTEKQLRGLNNGSRSQLFFPLTVVILHQSGRVRVWWTSWTVPQTCGGHTSTMFLDCGRKLESMKQNSHVRNVVSTLQIWFVPTTNTNTTPKKRHRGCNRRSASSDNLIMPPLFVCSKWYIKTESSADFAGMRLGGGQRFDSSEEGERERGGGRPNI